MKIAKIVAFCGITTCLAVGAVAQEGGRPPQQDSPRSRRGGWNASGPDGQKFQGVAGQITSISADTIKLKMPNGQEATVKIAADTQFRRDRSPAKLQDFKVGEFVGVRGTPAGENQWTAQSIGTRS